MNSVGKSFLSFLVTVSMLVVSLVLLHETHQFSSTYVAHSTQIWALAVICPLLSILSYMSPITAVLSMIRNSDVSTFPIAVIMAQAAQNVACAAYGIQIRDDPFFISSAVGLVFQLIWLTAYFTIARRRPRGTKSLYRIHPIVASVGMTISMVVVVYALTIASIDAVGTISCGMTLLLCVSPLATLGVVVRSRNSASIPIPMSVIMLLSNIAWGIYGILLKDNFIILPSLLGVIITVFQLIVTAWCNGLLFYDLTFLQDLFGAAAYTSVLEGSPVGSPVNRQLSRHSSISVYGLEEQQSSRSD